MSVIGRTWTTVDDSISWLLEDYKQTTGVSYRDLAEKSGLKYSRLRDLVNRVNGTPTVSEFITICQLRGEDPADTLRSILADTPLLDDEQASDDAPLTADEIMTLAANTDPNRDAEEETPRD